MGSRKARGRSAATLFLEWLRSGERRSQLGRLLRCFHSIATSVRRFLRLVVELAQVKAFAQFIKDRPSDLCNWISNPTAHCSLPREPYDPKVEEQLGYRIAETLNLPDREWWRRGVSIASGAPPYSAPPYPANRSLMDVRTAC